MNYLAIIVAVIANMGLGMLWFGPFFGKAWCKEMNISEKEMKKQQKKGMAGMWRGMVAQALSSLVTAYVISFFLDYLNVQSALLGMQVIFWLWLGFLGAVTFGEMFWEKRSVKLWTITAAYRLVSLLIMAAIIGRWG